MKDIQYKPDYIFEVSWEVCNKVGGIHTVLCTKAPLLQENWGDRLIMIGPDLHTSTGAHPEFTEDKDLFPTWKAHVEQAGLRVRTGRWNIPGQPLVMLIDFTTLYQQKNAIFTDLWVKFRLDSLSGQWDYIEPALFGYAAGMAIAQFYHCHLNATDRIIAQFHEWMTGAGILYLESNIPQVATVFTTHATVLGRALAGAGLPLYNHLTTINPEQAARDYNITSKHSLEKTAAATADCFTCVSELTAQECEHLLGKHPDIITPNGFSAAFVPDDKTFNSRRAAARNKLLAVATALLQQPLPDDSLLVLNSGRYEFHNKGIDLFIDSMGMLNKAGVPGKTIIAFLFIPAAHTGPRKTLQDRLLQPDLSHPRSGEILTHNLQGEHADPVMNRIQQRQMDNAPGSPVKIIFAPIYLDGADGIFNAAYYDIIIGFDLAVFPSFYEPWGYTPLESLAFHIPAVTTSIAGFGATVSRLPAYNGQGLYIANREESDEQAAAAIAGIIKSYATQAADVTAAARQSAFSISLQFRWEHLIGRYYTAYDIALQKSQQREELFREKPQAAPLVIHETTPAPAPVWRSLQVQAALPAALQALQEIAANLWWSWNTDAAALFACIDDKQWEESGHNPLAVISTMGLDAIRKLMNDSRFMGMLKTQHTRLLYYLQAPPARLPLAAYFSMEYGLLSGLKIYAGGLGVLAGDYLKAASDSYMPLVAVGLLYQDGYFKQVISPQGDQVALPDHLDTSMLPLYRVNDSTGKPLVISVAFPGRTVSAGVWKVNVGRIALYLLDTQVAANRQEDRRICARLYPGNRELRLQQEILLGIGGVRLLAALDIQPDVFHINEGHAAFTVFERIRQLMQHAHLDFNEALEIIKASTQFTTHTAVAAAMDLFDEAQLRAYLSYLATDFNISWEQLMAFGQANGNREKFSMFYLAAHLSQEINAVSKLHRQVSCKLLQPLWKDFRPGELHITSVTNGVHVPTWTAVQWQQLPPDEKAHIADLPPARIWALRQALKQEMLQAIRSRLQTALTGAHENAGALLRMLNGLKSNALFIGFARRFAPYKRAQLLFTDLQRLAAIVNNAARHVFIIFAGKAHPDDGEGAALIKKVILAARQPELSSHILFLEDYDMALGALLVKGVDVWLNTPRPEREASGTSGMKAVLNGVLHCSVKDGWWAEACREGAGWVLEGSYSFEEEVLQDTQDAALLYSMLENDIVPLFYERNSDGLPEAWINRIKRSFADIAPACDMQRVAGEYGACYEKLHSRSQVLQANRYALAKELAAWKKKMLAAWQQVHVMDMRLPNNNSGIQKLGESFSVSITLSTGSLAVNDLGVEILVSAAPDTYDYLQVQALPVSAVNGSRVTFSNHISLAFSGSYTYSFRVFAKHTALPHRMDFPLVTWI